VVGGGSVAFVQAEKVKSMMKALNMRLNILLNPLAARFT
jgi:hypothetical protein